MIDGCIVVNWIPKLYVTIWLLPAGTLPIPAEMVGRQIQYLWTMWLPNQGLWFNDSRIFHHSKVNTRLQSFSERCHRASQCCCSETFKQLISTSWNLTGGQRYQSGLQHAKRLATLKHALPSLTLLCSYQGQKISPKYYILWPNGLSCSWTGAMVQCATEVVDKHELTKTQKVK